MKTVAILASTAALAQAIQMNLTPRLPHTEFKHVSKLSEASPGDTIAAVGIPGYINPQSATTVISVNTRFTPDEDERLAQRELLRSQEATPDQIAAELANSNTYVVMPQSSITEAAVNIQRAEIAYLKAKTPEAKETAREALMEVLLATHPALTIQPEVTEEQPA